MWLTICSCFVATLVCSLQPCDDGRVRTVQLIHSGQLYTDSSNIRSQRQLLSAAGLLYLQGKGYDYEAHTLHVKGCLGSSYLYYLPLQLQLLLLSIHKLELGVRGLIS